MGRIRHRPGRLAYPRGAAVNTVGELYVANTGNDRIDVFDASGTLKRSFGTSGRAVGQFDGPLGVAADSTGIRAVTDPVNGRVQLINPDGTIATVWGSPNPGPTVLPNPVAVAFDAGGNGFVLDNRRSTIVVFDRATATTTRRIGHAGLGPRAAALSASPGDRRLGHDLGGRHRQRPDRPLRR